MTSSAPRRHLLAHLVGSLVVSIAALQLMAWLLAGVTVDGWSAGILTTVVIAGLNAVFWTVIVRFVAPLVLWMLGLFGIVVNGLLMMAAAELVEGFEVSSLGVAIVASLGMTAVSAVVGSLLSVDDDDVWRRQVMRRVVDRSERPERTDVPGVLFLQIDGLSEPVMRRALSEGYLPTLARWVRGGTHRILRWECDLSSQTGASQAGILHGNNVDMPAFRWYDKDLGRVLTSNRPRDAAEIERQRSDGEGLLADRGVSRSNVFSGDSAEAMLTFSTATDRSRRGRRGATYVLTDPYAISRLLVLAAADIAREVAARWRARRRDIQPRLRRGGVYPLLRAATTVLLRDLTIYSLMSDVYRGIPVAYADFVGYDEVAHHSGISAPDALEVLYRLDQQFARLERAIADAPRPYHVVVLSDHGQTQGSTFLQRYGISLPELVSSLIGQGEAILAPELSTEGWGNLNGLLSTSVDEETRSARLLRVLVQRRTVDDEVTLGPGFGAETSTEGDEVVVLASGNLGLISFPEVEGRASLETLATRHPDLVQRLAAHPGIGFVLVRSETFGPLVIGGGGLRYLADDHVEGLDPLEGFGPRAADHLRRTDAFRNTPDILVNSFYDPNADEGAAFEELIGFHGGLGGKQTEPFVLFPATFPVPDEPLVGAASIYRLFKDWLARVGDGELPPPWEVTTAQPAGDVRLPLPGADEVGDPKEPV